MNPFVELNLAFLLFLPWYLVLAAAFWWFPRVRKPARVRWFEIGSLLAAIGAAVVGGIWGFRHADTSVGAIWQQVLASLVCYGLFLAVLGIAALLRRPLLRR